MRNLLRGLLGKRPIEKSRNVFEIAEHLAEYDETRESRGIVANVEIRVDPLSDNFSKDLEKFKGTYPLELESGQYRVLYDEKPKRDLTTIRAVVGETTSNVRFAKGIRGEIVNKYNLIHGYSFQIHKEYPLVEVDIIPHVNAAEDSNELGISKGETIYISTKK